MGPAIRLAGAEGGANSPSSCLRVRRKQAVCTSERGTPKLLCATCARPSGHNPWALRTSVHLWIVIPSLSLLSFLEAFSKIEDNTRLP